MAEKNDRFQKSAVGEADAVKTQKLSKKETCAAEMQKPAARENGAAEAQKPAMNKTDTKKAQKPAKSRASAQLLQHRSTIKRVLAYIGNYKWWVLVSLILAGVTVAATLYAPILVGDAVDLIVAPGNVDFTGIRTILYRMAAVVAVTGAAQWLMNHINNRITYQVVKDIRTRAFGHLEVLPLRYIDSHPSGDVISRIIADIDQFSEGLLMGFTQLFTGVITILGTLGFMFVINYRIAVVVVFVTPVSLVVASYIAKRTYVMFRKQSETRGELTSLVDEMLGNQKIVQAFGHEDEAQEQFEEINERLRGYSLRATFFSSITNPCTRFVNSVVYASVGVVGALAAVRGLLSVGQLSIFLRRGDGAAERVCLRRAGL